MAREDLRRRIAELEAENERIRDGVFRPANGQLTVIAPEQLREQFDRAQLTVDAFFRGFTADPARGWIEIGDDRYVLVRASALSIEFFDTLRELYVDRGQQEADAIGRRLLFDIAHAAGISDARRFHQRMNLTDPVAKLAAGPVHFAYTGWALVDIKPESRPAPDDDCLIVYDHPYSFEASSWIRAGRASGHPVCIMNAGYSSGWCEESFGVPLVAVELTCRACGDPECHFLMAHPDRIEAQVAAHAARFGPLSGIEPERLTIPEFFQNKRLEEELQRAQQLLESRVEQRTAQLSRANAVLRDEIDTRQRLEQELRKVAEINQALAAKVIDAQEEERKRVSRELHDSVGQVLTALKMDAEWIALHTSDGKDVQPLADRLATNLSEMIATVRGVVRGLRPPLLDDVGVASAIEDHATEIGRRFDLGCETEIVANTGDVPPGVATAVFRITQEALRNVVRHARARRAKISYEDTGSEVILSVQDDGRGMADCAIRTTDSLGIVGMRERAALLGGELSIASRQGQGTTVTARIPYQAAAEDDAAEDDAAEDDAAEDDAAEDDAAEDDAAEDDAAEDDAGVAAAEDDAGVDAG